MIVTRLNGGLGNQMFQWAAARSLAKRHHTEVAVDLSWFDRQHPDHAQRHFDLHHFRLPTRVIPKRAPGKRGAVAARIRAVLPGRWRVPRRVIREVTYHFADELRDAPDNVVLEGFWQSEKYFCDIRETLQTDFQPRAAPGPRTSQLLSLALESNSVGLHVRRGDYLDRNASNASVLSPDYYRHAVELVAAEVAGPTRFLVFSEDQQWCRDNIKLPQDTVYVDSHFGTSAFWDVVLMNNCRHMIIANSSFSWWGAWLRDGAGVTIAPESWAISPDLDTSDVIPDRWLRVPN